MIEVERKRELPDGPGTAREQLARCGYRESSTGIEIDTYYSRPDRDFMTTVECLRVRRRSGFAEITYKPSSDPATHSAEDIISKQELNVRLADEHQADLAEELLAVLGMLPLARVEKDRTLYRHPDHNHVLVALDTVAGVGAFAETEVTSTDSVAAAALLAEVEEQLGLTTYAVVTVPYRDLVLRQSSS